MFHDLNTPLVAETPQKRSLEGIGGFKLWCSRNQGFLLIAGLFALSLILVAIV